MRLDLGVYGALLAAGLGAAYWASLPASEGDEEKVSVYSVDAKQVAEVTYKAKDLDVTAERRDDGRFWVTYTKTEEQKAPPVKAGEKPQPAPPPKVTTERFLANEKMDELLKAFDPLYAVRVITSVDDKQMTEFGLKDKTEAIAVKDTGGKVFSLTLGKRSYGSRNRFALEGEGGKGRVLLVDDSAFENLERAPLRMYDRRIVGFELSEVAKAELRAGTKVKRLAHTQRDKSGELLWTEDEDNAQPKPSYDAWMDKVAKLRLASYPEAADAAALKDAKPFLEITYEKDGKPLDHLRFVKTGADKPIYWVASDFIKGYAKVVNNRVEPIEKDIGQIVTDTPKS